MRGAEGPETHGDNYMQKRLIQIAALVVLLLFVFLTVRWFEGRELGTMAMRLIRSPVLLLVMTVSYGASFLLKAAAWRLYVRRERTDKLTVYLYPLLVSLLVNHLLPLKVGDLARTGMLSRSAKMRWDDALHSVAVMRALDMGALLLIGGAGTLMLGIKTVPAAVVLIGAAVCILLIIIATAVHKRTKKRQNRPAGNGSGKAIEWIMKHIRRLSDTLCSWRGAAAAGLTGASWVLEGAVIFGVMSAFGHPLGTLQAVWANSMTIIGQLLQVTPGGLGTYETTLTAALALLGVPVKVSYAAAIVSHGYKYLFAYISGGLALAAAAVSAAELRAWLRIKQTKND
jgi:uncharacterized protein (TIRG00374 family)